MGTAVEQNGPEHDNWCEGVQQIYFAIFGSSTWTPVSMIELTKQQACDLAEAFKDNIPKYRWGYGPAHRDGLTEV